MNDVYQDGTYLRLNPGWHAEDSAWKVARIAQIIDRNGLKPKTIAEVGCGTGQILHELSKVYPSAAFYGFEVSQVVSNLWDNSNPRVHLSLADFRQQQERYDILLAIDIVEHIEDYIGFLRDLLHRADHFVFHIPIEMSAQQVLRDIQLRTRATYGHIHYFSKATAIATLEDAGYRVLDSFYTDTSVQYASNHQNRRMQAMNVLRGLLFTFRPHLTVRLLGGYELMVLAAPKGGSVAAPTS